MSRCGPLLTSTKAYTCSLSGYSNGVAIRQVDSRPCRSCWGMTRNSRGRVASSSAIIRFAVKVKRWISFVVDCVLGFPLLLGRLGARNQRRAVIEAASFLGVLEEEEKATARMREMRGAALRVMGFAVVPPEKVAHCGCVLTGPGRTL